METLNLVEKNLYQLIICRLEGERVRHDSYREEMFDFVQRGIGGFIVFGGKKEDIGSFISEMQSVSEIPLFVASDIERGVGQQIEGCTQFPCQMAVAAAIDKSSPRDGSFLEESVKAIADEARDIGINMPLIPVLDVNQDPDNPIICTRAFSDDPHEVAWFGKVYVRTLEKSGLISCGKHFPGHGDTSTDSHLLLPVIGKSRRDLMDVDIFPFREAVRAGISSIMVGHLLVRSIGKSPASLSKEVIADLLRKEIGFEGLILTDALNMQALKNMKNVPARSIRAGADILLHPADPEFTVKELIYGLVSGEITEKHIGEALKRIETAKNRLQKNAVKEIDYGHHIILTSRITDASISLVKKTPGVLPVSGRDNLRLIFAGEHESFRTSALDSRFSNISVTTDGIEPEDEKCVFAVFTNVAAWKGTSGLSYEEKVRIQELVGKAYRSIVVSFGSPYVLRHFQEADVLIAAYEASENAQNAVIRCLEGRLDFSGRLPVSL
jgi:beta-N-acetylhexosaminidase